MDSCEPFMRAAEARYGSEYQKQMYQMELENRNQKSIDFFQQFASEFDYWVLI